MNKLGKIIIFFVALFVLAFVAVAAIIHFYVTDERVRAIVVPQAEKALDRNVSIGAIKIGIFSGITIADLAVKEKGQQGDFVKAGSFVLTYDLLPLLQKKFVINEIRLNEPVINIVRDKNGKFNFNSLALLKNTPSNSAGKDGASTSEPVALPISLTIEKITIVKGVLVVRDAKKEIPDAKVIADLNVSLNMADNLDSLTFKGALEMTAEMKYGDLSPHARISADFDQERLNYQADIDVSGEKVHIAGYINQFMTASPEIVCNVSSKQLNIDHLLALADTLPKSNKATEKNGATAGGQKKEAIAKTIPVGLVARGVVSVNKAFYRKIAVTDFKINYDLRQGIFTKTLTANALGGTLHSNTIVDLNELDPTYKGDIAINSVDLKQLAPVLGTDFKDVIAGSFQSKMNFDGRGIEMEVIKKNLTMDAAYTLSNGWIKGTQITKAVSRLTGLAELQDMAFDKMAGTVRLLKGGKMRLVTSMNAANLGMETDGEIDLDGNLDLPITLTLSPLLTKKLDQKAAVSRFLANDKGETELHLKVSGTTKKPRTSLDTRGIEKQLQGVVKAKALDAIGGLLSKEIGAGAQSEKGTGSSSSNQPVFNLLKGLMGQ